MDPNFVLDFWLGGRGPVPPSRERIGRWFAVDPEFDASIRSGFDAAVGRALGGEFGEWETDPQSRVALVLLLDQFPRNLYRDDPRSFAGDPRGLELTRRTSETELDALHPLERYFALVPWMHAEDLQAQVAGEAAFSTSVDAVPAEFRSLFENGLGYATRHRRVIERFGRFPHRNAVLDREATPEERAFVEEFGTGF